MSRIVELINKALPTLMLSLIGSALTLWQDSIVMKQEIATLKTDVSRLERGHERVQEELDRQSDHSGQVISRLDAIVENSRRPQNRR